MENAEEILHALDQFSRLKPKEIPPELEEYLRYVSKTGDPIYQWPLIKPLFVQKLHNVITEFFESSPILEIPPSPNVEPFNYERMKTSLIERLDSFLNPPFTIQRISELLVSPRNEYNRIDKYMRAVEKNVLVVSTREPNLRSHSENDKITEAVNGIPENNGTVEDVDVNMLNSDLALQNTPSQPTDELLDIKADELEMDSLLMESIPDSKWVKTNTMTPDINSVVSMATEMTSDQSNTVEMSTDIDLVSNSDNSAVIQLETKPSSTSEIITTEASVEPMCIEPNPSDSNLTEHSTTEPMAVESTVVESMSIETPDLTSESIMQETDSIKISSSLEPVDVINNQSENSTETPGSQIESIDVNSVSNDQINDASEAEVKDLNLLSNESMVEDQPLVTIEPSATDVSSTADLPITSDETTPPFNECNLTSDQECKQLSNITELNLDSSEMLTESLSSSEDGVQSGNVENTVTAEENSEVQVEKMVEDQLICTKVEEMSPSTEDISSTSTPVIEENSEATTLDKADCSNIDSTETPIVTMPDDETTLNEASSSVQIEDIVQKPEAENVSVTFLDESEPPSVNECTITSSPVVIEPEDSSETKSSDSTVDTTQD